MNLESLAPEYTYLTIELSCLSLLRRGMPVVESFTASVCRAFPLRRHKVKKNRQNH